MVLHWAARHCRHPAYLPECKLSPPPFSCQNFLAAEAEAEAPCSRLSASVSRAEFRGWNVWSVFTGRQAEARLLPRGFGSRVDNRQVEVAQNLVSTQCGKKWKQRKRSVFHTWGRLPPKLSMVFFFSKCTPHPPTPPFYIRRFGSYIMVCNSNLTR